MSNYILVVIVPTGTEPNLNNAKRNLPVPLRSPKGFSALSYWPMMSKGTPPPQNPNPPTFNLSIVNLISSIGQIYYNAQQSLHFTTSSELWFYHPLSLSNVALDPKHKNVK